MRCPSDDESLGYVKNSGFLFNDVTYLHRYLPRYLTTYACKKGTFGVLHFQIIDIFYDW